MDGLYGNWTRLENRVVLHICKKESHLLACLTETFVIVKDKEGKSKKENIKIVTSTFPLNFLMCQWYTYTVPAPY